MQRERERKNRKKRKYGQAKLKHAKRGVLSCTISCVVGVLLLAMIFSYVQLNEISDQTVQLQRELEELREANQLLNVQIGYVIY